MRLSHRGGYGGKAMSSPLRMKQPGWLVLNLCLLGQQQETP
jgi:hypothetical protein